MQELADYVDIPVSEVKELMFRASQPLSLETKIGEGEDNVLLDLISDDNDSPSEQIEMDSIFEFLKTEKTKKTSFNFIMRAFHP